MPEGLEPTLAELRLLTDKIASLQQEVIEVSRKRRELAHGARNAGASMGTIAEACGLSRGSYPVRR